MKRGSKKKHLESEETSSGSSSDSAEKKEVIKDRNESFDDPTSQKQTEAGNENETSERFKLHGAEIHDEPVDWQPRPTPLSLPVYGCMMHRTKPNKNYDVKHESYSLPGFAEVNNLEQLKTQSLLDKTTSLLPEGQTPASSIRPTGSKEVEFHSALMLDEPRPHEGVLLRPSVITGASATRSELPSDFSLKHQPGSVFTQSSVKEYLDPLLPSPMFTHPVLRYYQKTKLEKKETETTAGIKRSGSWNRLSESYIESLCSPIYRDTFRHSPDSHLGIHGPKEPVSLMTPLASTNLYSQHKDAGVFNPSLPSQYALGSLDKLSLSPLCAIRQFPEHRNKRLKGLEGASGVQRESKPASDQELSGQEKKKEEEANHPARHGGVDLCAPYPGPELSEDLSLQSTRQLKPDNTNMEQKISALIHHQHAQLSVPTPEYINTETQEEAGPGSGSLSVPEGTELIIYENPGPDQDLLEADPPILAELLSDSKALPPSFDVQFCSTDTCWTRRRSSSVPGCVSMPSLSHITSAGNNKPTRAASLPDMKLQSNFEEFTPDLSEDDEDHEGYRFQCSCPGLYQCSVTGLVFDMEGEGDVVYRTVPWNRRLLVQHHKKPAGPLFDIKCEQQSVRQLHLPHCQILPTAGFLAVAHVKDDGVEFISPHKITETHLVINIRGFSGFGNVKDEDSPPDPVRALVLLFYRPPDDPDVTSILNVLLLPRNIVIRDVQRTRKKLFGDERFIDVPPHCKLIPDQVYTLSTVPEDDLIKVQPTEAEFDEESYSSYFTSIKVTLKALIRDINLSLKDKKTSCCVWEGDICLLPSRAKTLTLSSKEKLLDVRSSFIDRTSGPVLNSLLDKLLEKKVLTDSERESADVMPNRRDKARFIIDTVRKKGDTASSEMIEFLCELDPFLCRDLNLM